MSQRFRLQEAALPLLIAVSLLLCLVLVGSTAFYWPLAAGAVVGGILAYRAGFPLRSIWKAVKDGANSTFIALSILILVGGLIGVWKASGTVPAMVYYGLTLANPRFLVPTAFLLALATSMMLGTSIGTVSTLGVAVMGVAQGVGAPLPLVAGALWSGALFGDRSSPLSGSLNLNVAMTGTDLRRAMTALLPTGIIAAVITLVGYLFLGLHGTMAATGGDSGLRDAIAARFAVSPWLLVPPILVLLLAFLRVPVRWALGVGMIAGGAVAARAGVSVVVPVRASLFGYGVNGVDGSLTRILSGGGILPMWNQVVLILTAGAFSGIMEATGMMSVVISHIVERVRRPISMVATTMAVSVSVSALAANQALAIIVPGRMLSPTYRELRLSPELLSRSLADSGTVLAGLIPWNIMAILSGAALGLPVRVFGPYTLFAYVLPIISLAYTLIREQRTVDTPLTSGQRDQVGAAR